MGELHQGPWRSAFYTSLPTRLRSKSNYRKGARGWAALASFESVTQATIAAAVPPDWPLGSKDASLASRPVVVMAVAARSTLDSANFTKSLADAMEGVVVHNDASIAGTATLAERGRKDQRCVVAAALLDPGADLAVQSAALQELVQRMPDLYEASSTD